MNINKNRILLLIAFSIITNSFSAETNNTPTENAPAQSETKNTSAATENVPAQPATKNVSTTTENVSVQIVTNNSSTPSYWEKLCNAINNGYNSFNSSTSGYAKSITWTTGIITTGLIAYGLYKYLNTSTDEDIIDNDEDTEEENN